MKLERARRHDDRARTTRRTITAAVAEALRRTRVASTGCETPIIALNELNGASTDDAVDGERTRSYRAERPPDAPARAQPNRARRPFLLVPGPVRGLKSPYIWRRGARLVAPGGSGRVPRSRAALQRALHLGMGPSSAADARGWRCAIAISAFTGIGIPAATLGLLLGFQSGPEGRTRGAPAELEPWFCSSSRTRSQRAGRPGARPRPDLVVGLGHVLRGWRRPGQAGGRLRLPLGARPALCDGPAVAGPGSTPRRPRARSLPTRGRAVRARRHGDPDIGDRPYLQGDRRAPASRVDGALPEGRRERAPPRSLPTSSSRRIKRILIALRFGGKLSPHYLAALRRAGASLAVARAVIADELRIAAHIAREAPRFWHPHRLQASRRSTTRIPTCRCVLSRPAAAAVWLGGRETGVRALFPPGPAQVLTLPTGSPCEASLSRARARSR